MAPFNNRQIGYIQAIAGRQQHTTLKCGHEDRVISSDDTIEQKLQPQCLSDLVKIHGHTGTPNYGTVTNSKSLLLHTWRLDNSELAQSSLAAHNNDALTIADFQNLTYTSRGFGNQTALSVFNADLKGYRTGDAAPSADGQVVRNPDHILSTDRASADGFLNSTDVKFRFTLPSVVTSTGTSNNSTHAMGQDHYEFRWIVWRQKRPSYPFNAATGATNADLIRQGASLRNPNYDLFMGQTGRKRGFLGYTFNPNLDKDKFGSDEPTERYSGAYLANGIDYGSGWQFEGSGADNDAKMLPEGEAKFTVDDLMTMRLNKSDYVIMKDVRFFLGKEHGKSHFEDNLHWDWNDPIDTDDSNVLTSPTLNDKNYRWNMTLLGTSGGPSPCTLNVTARWTTKMESG